MDAPTNNGVKASDPGSSPSSCTFSQSSTVSSNWWNGLGGNVDGSFFKASPKVDPEKRPGTTSLWIQHGTREEQTVGATLWKILSLQSFLYSPNLSWLLLALCVYGLFPYELSRQQGYWEIVVERSLVNVGVCVSYIAFWHVILYSAGWSKRPFVEGRTYNWNKVVHNIVHSMLGIIQWNFTEAAFLYCYQTGRLPIPSDLTSVSTVLIASIACVWMVPPYRDTQFYFTHRMIHANFLYKYIHATHHHTSDIEPFAGLAMHPTEHLYYFSCYGPLLLMNVHPFVLFWMGFHTVITPAASHSGYEDHFSADLMHYLHHRYYECNYGAGIPFDVWFGTYRDKLNESSTAQPTDGKARLGMMLEHPQYQIIAVVLPVMLLWFLDRTLQFLSPVSLAVTLTMLPVVTAAVLYGWSSLKGKSQTSPRGRHPLAPFHNDPLWSQGLHFSLGMLLGVAPVYQLLAVALSPTI